MRPKLISVNITILHLGIFPYFYGNIPIMSLINDKHPESSQAFWFRYKCTSGYGFCHIAVVADSLESAFEKASKVLKLDPLDLEYRNRVIEVLV